MAVFNITGYAVGGGIEIQSTIVGLDRTLAAVRAFGDKAMKELGGVLYREGEAIMAESKQEVPVDTGALRSTGHVQLPRLEGTETVVELGYGGPATPYALRQHEELGYRHKVGNAKYLANPFNRHLKGMDERLAADLRGRIGA